MKKIYKSPEIKVEKFNSKDIITASGLINGGANGKSVSESFSSLFGK